MITLRTQGEPNAQALFDLFCGNGITRVDVGGGWQEIRLTRWAGTDYSALIHARECFPDARIYCDTVKSARK